MPLYYLETDGEVFLIRKNGRWTFPSRRAELPCPMKPLYRIPIGKKTVLFCKPSLKRHPSWHHKDHLPGLPNIDPVVQIAVNRSLPRLASKMAIIEKGKVLLVRAKRGMTANIWNLPGGFVDYGQDPERSAEREVLEELGVRAKATALIGYYTRLFPSGGYMVSFVYTGKRLDSKIRLSEDEIEAVRWVPVRRAIRMIQNPFASQALKDCLKGIRCVVQPRSSIPPIPKNLDPFQ